MQPASSPGTDSRAGAARGRRSRAVLVVESSPDRQWRIARMLTVRGYRVVGTSSADGALALMKEWPVGVILVDAKLAAGMNGHALCDRLREEHPDSHVVLMGDSVDLDGAHPARPLSGYLRKPFTAEALLAAVERAGRSRGPAGTTIDAGSAS